MIVYHLRRHRYSWLRVCFISHQIICGSIFIGVPRLFVVVRFASIIFVFLCNYLFKFCIYFTLYYYGVFVIFVNKYTCIHVFVHSIRFMVFMLQLLFLFLFSYSTVINYNHFSLDLSLTYLCCFKKIYEYICTYCVNICFCLCRFFFLLFLLFIFINCCA